MHESEHHGDRWFKDAVEQSKARDRINSLISNISTVSPLGATGRFSEGALTPDDEGELQFAIRATGGKVVLAFGKPVEWIGMTPKIARELADKLSEWAAEA